MGRVFHVVGIQGAGKTWLCRKLGKKVKCYDTDDILRWVYKEVKHDQKMNDLLSSKRYFDWEKKFYELVHAKALKLARDNLNKGKSVVFAGITIHMPCDPGCRYFVQITDLEEAYRRVIRREAVKIKDGYKTIIKATRLRNVYAIEPTIGIEVMPALSLKVPFEGYKALYDFSLKMEKEYKSRIMTQSKILKDILERSKKKGTSSVLEDGYGKDPFNLSQGSQFSSASAKLADKLDDSDSDSDSSPFKMTAPLGSKLSSDSDESDFDGY